MGFEKKSNFLLYFIFFRDHLYTDMKDPQLIHWTKPPGVFLVATTESEKVVGCICYKKIDADTVEMHRLAVDAEFRGLKIGRKLVQALIDTAKESGYNTMYLGTSTAQINAIKLYEKMEFEFLQDKKYFPRYHLVGLKNVCYVKHLK